MKREISDYNQSNDKLLGLCWPRKGGNYIVGKWTRVCVSVCLASACIPKGKIGDEL